MSLPAGFELALERTLTAIAERYDPSRPATSEHESTQALEAFLGSVPPNDYIAIFETAAKHVAAAPEALQSIVEDDLRSSKRNAAADPRYSLLLNFVREQEKNLPGLATVVWSALWRRDIHARNIDMAGAELAKAAGSTGEDRATHALLAAQSVAARLYEPYLRSLVNLDRASRTDPRLATETFGVLVDSCSNSLLRSFPKLVDRDASFLRNAIAHEHREYRPHNDTVEVWDSNRPPRVISVHELIGRVQAMYLLAGPTFLHVRDLLMWRALRETLPDALGRIFRALSTPDIEGLSDLDDLLRPAYVRAFGPARIHYEAWRAACPEAG